MIGETILHYKIIEKLGEGGMGVVYKAQDLNLDRLVALKFLPQEVTSDEADKARFLQEARAASALNHPHVCHINAILESEGRQFIDMEYIEGVTLRRTLPVKDLQDALRYAIQIGEALEEAHGKGIVHRDVKCENIMVNVKNQIKVMDFGLAKLRGSLKLTKTSSTIGTLAYMAPEQIQGGTVDARSDLFSFGVVLFELLTGKLPFRGEHEAAMMYSIVNEDPDSVLKHRGDLSPELDRIVGRALEKDPADRYQHADDMVSELRRLQKQSTRVSRELLTTPARTIPSPAGPPAAAPVKAPRKKGLIVGIAGAVLAMAAGLAFYLLAPKTPQSFDSLAVLPFVNATADPGSEYLSDGMTESIINTLTRIPQLRVIPRSTVFRFKGKDIDPQEAGNTLKVSAVLTGRVTQHGEELNVQVDLIDLRTQSQVWGEQYRRKVNDVISLQEEIVSEVSRRLQTALSGETRKDLAKRLTENPEAYKLYLQGRYFWQKRRAPELRKSIEFFHQAIALDPNFALAYSALADAYVLLEQYAGVPWMEIAPRAKSAGEKARDLDPALGEAHASLAMIRMSDWEWDAADQEFKSAIALNPKYPTAYHWYSILLSRRGRYPEAFEAIQHALALDPLSPVILLNVGILYDRLKDDSASAILYLHKALELDEAFAPAYHQLGKLQIRRGLLAEGVASLEKGVELSQRAAENLSSLGHALAVAGRAAEARALLTELEHLYTEHKTSAYNVARVYAGLGEKEHALSWLERDLADHSSWLPWLNFDFEWKALRDDPRFLALVEKIGLSR